MKSRVTIIHPIDPLGSRVGGTGTFLRGFIKYAPLDLEIDFIGVTSNKMDCPVGEWRALSIGNRSFKFLPALYEKDENKKTIIPLSFRFTWKLMLGNYIANKTVLFFNRLEPAWAWRKSKLPKIIIIHSDIQQGLKKGRGESFWGNLPFAYIILERYLIRLFSQVYSVSRGSIDYYVKRYLDIKDKVSFLPTFVDTDIFHPASESKIDIRAKLVLKYPELSARESWILFVGRIQKVKEPFRLVKSFNEYFLKARAGRLIVIGDGNLKADLESYIIKVGLGGRVSLLGKMPPEELSCFYQAADVLLLTSNFEGMPMSVLEALGCGLPVVTTNVGEVNRIVKNGYSGEVTKGFDPQDIAGNITKVLTNLNIYTKENCVKCVADYAPAKVLKPLYVKMEELYRTQFNLKD